MNPKCEGSNMQDNLKHLRSFLFNPKSVVVIGASEKKGSLGRAIMENLLAKFKGKIYPVNIVGDTIFGMNVYRSVLEIQEDIDLAVIIIPARFVPSVIEQCGKKGIKAAVVISAGFKEVDDEGAKLEEQTVNIAKKYGIRILGPNCLGIYNTESGLDLIFNPNDRQDKPEAGNVAFLSQSGALGAACLDYFANNQIGLTSFVSYGNAADIDESELVEYFGYDRNTKVISLYIEALKDGRKFMEIARKIVKHKPIIILKAGRTQAGSKAAKSHTGALSGNIALYEAAFKQVGVIQAKSMEDLFIKIKSLSVQQPAKGKNVVILTNGGGAGVLATDATEMEGLSLSKLSDETIEKLREVLPPSASPYNPVDILGDAPTERYTKSFDILKEDQNVDAIVVIILPQSPAVTHDELVTELAIRIKKCEKPVAIAIPGGRIAKDLIKKFVEHKIPAFGSPEEAVAAIHALVEYGEILKKFA